MKHPRYHDGNFSIYPCNPTMAIMVVLGVLVNRISLIAIRIPRYQEERAWPAVFFGENVTSVMEGPQPAVQKVQEDMTKLGYVFECGKLDAQNYLRLSAHCMNSAAQEAFCFQDSRPRAHRIVRWLGPKTSGWLRSTRSELQLPRPPRAQRIAGRHQETGFRARRRIGSGADPSSFELFLREGCAPGVFLVIQ